MNHLKYMAIVLTGFIGCADQSQKEEPKKKNQKAASGAEDADGSPTSSPVPSSSPSAAKMTCDEQWKAHVTFFKSGLVLTYKSNINALSQDVPVTHTEQILESSDAQVVRKLTLSSTNPLATQVLGQVKIPPQLTVKKAAFIDVCKKSENKAQPPIPISTGTVTLKSVTEENLAMASGNVPSQHFKVSVGVTLSSKASNAEGDIWGSQKVPGLGLKHNLVLSGIPVVGSATLTSELQTPAAQ
ncbi:MAG: hypothetical protein NT027_11060 [Proteobacteria bacterium]|nr:hypothetical protein [Pseudomonadota bacterium]